MSDKVFDTKMCPDCREEKPIYEFSLRSSVTGKRASKCKPCHRAYVREHYAKNKKKYKDRAKKWVKDNPEKRKAVASNWAKKNAWEQKRLAVEYKGGKCAHCGGVFHQAAFDFHHRDPREKEYHLSQLLAARGFEAAKQELDKCDLLCSNCHRIHHAEE